MSPSSTPITPAQSAAPYQLSRPRTAFFVHGRRAVVVVAVFDGATTVVVANVVAVVVTVAPLKLVAVICLLLL